MNDCFVYPAHGAHWKVQRQHSGYSIKLVAQGADVLLRIDGDGSKDDAARWLASFAAAFGIVLPIRYDDSWEVQ